MNNCSVCNEDKKIFALGIKDKNVCGECFVQTLNTGVDKGVVPVEMLDKFNDFVVKAKKDDVRTATWIYFAGNDK